MGTDLGCNLAGMIPWVGSPTGVLAVTAALATGTFVTTVIAGSIMHKPIGFWLNQIPSLELSFAIALIIKPMLWVIEIAGLEDEVCGPKTTKSGTLGSVFGGDCINHPTGE